MPNIREKLAEIICDNPFLCVPGGFLFYEKAADNLIANGVTVPVRCKECKFWREDILIDDDDTKCCSIGMYMTKGNNFCSFGKRRDGE